MIETKIDGKETTIYLYGRVGTDFTDADFSIVMNAVKTDILNIRINSPGGDVFQGNAIYSTIKSFKGEVFTFIDGVAASMASVIALAGKRVYMAENAMYMIHNPSFSNLKGDSRELRKQADFLEKVKATMVKAYSGKTGILAETINEMLDFETWLTSQEALKLKFIDEIIEDVFQKSAKASKLTALTASSIELFNEYQLINNKQNEGTMDLNELISRLKLAKGADMTAVLDAVDKLMNENETLKAGEEKVKKAEAETVQAVLNNAVNHKKITVDMMPKFQALLEADFENTSSVLNMMPAAQKLSDLLDYSQQSNNVTTDINSKAKSQWNLDDYRRFAPLELQRNPKLYASLCDKAGIIKD